jgi:fused signal recognition particle receptor
VAYDAIEHAKARHIDFVLIDTAGRMQTNINLMEEMKKIKRVAKPDMIIFVGDALTGNDAVEQALSFEKEIGIDGVILCKIDADAKGGCALSIAYTINKPIFFVGVGQEYRNLAKFNPDWMMKRLFSETSE